MQSLRYVGKNLFLEKISLKNFLRKNKTPFYIYSENQIIYKLEIYFSIRTLCSRPFLNFYYAPTKNRHNRSRTDLSLG